MHNAFGPLVSLLNGMANLLCNVFDCALYPLLLSQYVERAMLPLLPTEPHGGAGATWWRELAPDLAGSILRLGVVGLAAAVNVLGASWPPRVQCFAFPTPRLPHAADVCGRWPPRPRFQRPLLPLRTALRRASEIGSSCRHAP